MSNDKIEELKTPKSPSETVANQLIETEKKKLSDEFKKACEEVVAAKKVLMNAVEKAKDLEDKILSAGNNKLDLKGLAEILGI